MAVAGKAALTMEGAWSSTVDYDRLTGVVHNNSLFISRKKPPIGVEPSDGEYWMLCIEGVAEQDLEALETRVNDFETNYYPKTGGQISGDVTIKKYDNGYSEIFKNHGSNADYGTELVDVSKDGLKARIVLNASAGMTPQFYDKDGNGGGFYGVFNKPTAYELDVLALSGGTIRGDIDFAKFDNGKAKLYKNHSEEVDYGVVISDFLADGSENRLSLSADPNRSPLFFRVRDVVYDVFSEYNKPFGSYTGNGSATSRTIDTGGIGRLLLVYKKGSDVASLVTPQGALVKNIGEADGTQAASAYFVDGVFTIATTSAYFNTSGATYYYQVI